METGVLVTVTPLQGSEDSWTAFLGLQPRLSQCGPSALETIGAPKSRSKGPKVRNVTAAAEARGPCLEGVSSPVEREQGRGLMQHWKCALLGLIPAPKCL